MVPKKTVSKHLNPFSVNGDQVQLENSSIVCLRWWLIKQDRCTFCKASQETRDAFHYARPTSPRPVELTKAKWNDIVRKKQVFHLRCDQNFEVELETRIFENGKAGFGRKHRCWDRLQLMIWFWETFTNITKFYYYIQIYDILTQIQRQKSL